MASLQHNGPFSSGSSTWKIRNNALAIEELRKERRAVIESGNLKARRLSYNDDHMEMVLGATVHELDGVLFSGSGNYWDGLLELERDEVVPYLNCSDSDHQEYGGSEESSEEAKESEAVCLHCLSYAVSESSCSATASCPSGKKMEEEEEVEKEEATADEETSKVAEKGRNRGKREFAMVWFGITLVMILIVVSVLRRMGLGFGEYDEDHHLVPT